MPDTYTYDGAAWRKASEIHVYDGSVWRDCSKVYAYDGAAWRLVFEAVSCPSATCNSIVAVWGSSYGTSCTACAGSDCSYCMKADWTDCDDACHEIDGEISKNGASYQASTACTNKSCTFDGSCHCGAGGIYDFSCEGHRLANCRSGASDSYQGRLHIKLLSDATTVCTLTGGSKTGSCVA